jgi:spermidine synthase
MADAASAATPSPASGAEDAAARRAVLVALGAVGAAALLAQAVLLRELLASFLGNELSLGFALAAWLALTAITSAMGGRVVRPAAARRALGAGLLGAPALLWLALWLTRLARPAGLLAGEEPGLFASLRGAFVALGPACALAGFGYALGAAALRRGRDATAETGPQAATTPISGAAATTASRAYVAETVGAALAGGVFHFLLAERLTAAWVMTLAGVLGAVGGAAVLWPRRRSAALLAGLAVLAAGAVIAPRLGAAVDRARFPGADLVATRPSRYGQLAVTARAGQRAFFHDGVLLFTTEDAEAAEERVHLPLLVHPAPRRLLLVGGGLGGGLAEALKHHPEAIDYVELDPGVIAFAQAHAGAAAIAPLADPRVHLHVGDGRDLLRQRAAAYDVILVALPEPQSAVLSRFYSRECYLAARRALRPGGLIAVSTAASDAALDGATARRNAVLWRTLGGVFPAVHAAPGAQAVVWASATPLPADPDLLARRLRERRLELRRVGPTWLLDRLLPLRVEDYLAAVRAAGARENRDFTPVAYFYGLTEALARSAPSAGRAALRLADASRAPWWLPGLALGAALLVALVRRRRGAPAFAALAVGAAGMALQLAVLLVFQAVRGHLYHAVGGLAAAFMVGLAAGGTLGPRLARHPRGLALACVGAAAVGALAPAVFAAAAAWPAAAGALVFLLAALVGGAVGASYGPAVAALAARGAGSRAAARVYALDLGGAALAALVATLVTIPLFGIVPTAFAAAALCAGAAVANLARGD